VNAVITGVTGFAGSFLAEHLLAEGDRVLGCSRRGVWPAFVPPHVRSSIPLTTWDFSKPSGSSKAEQEILEFQPDCIYHLAALSVPRDCGQYLPNTLAAAVNVGGVASVLDLAARLPQKPRVLLISTSLVYDLRSVGQGSINEQGPIGPHNGYGWSKLLAETMSVPFTAKHDVELIRARAFQHTGPRQHAGMMLPDWMLQFVDGQTAPIHVHNLNTTIDLTDVRDVVRAYRLLMQHGKAGEVYNVGSGVAVQTGEVFEILKQLAGKDRQVIERSPGLNHRPVADIARLAACTHWCPQISLPQTVADTLTFWKHYKLELTE
jgi:GDP-4-dehydro-6-deoxy-D-mannose reductase